MKNALIFTILLLFPIYNICGASKFTDYEKLKPCEILSLTIESFYRDIQAKESYINYIEEFKDFANKNIFKKDKECQIILEIAILASYKLADSRFKEFCPAKEEIAYDKGYQEGYKKGRLINNTPRKISGSARFNDKTIHDSYLIPSLNNNANNIEREDDDLKRRQHQKEVRDAEIREHYLGETRR